MFKQFDILRVNSDGKPVGRLAMAPDRRCVFEYDAGWIETGFSISPFYLPLQSGAFTARPDPFDGLFGVFSDSLPDGWGNLLLDRLLIRKGIHPGTLTPLDRLSIVGSSGMGSLTYHPENQLSSGEDQTDLNYLAGEVEKILSEENSGNLELLYRKNGSSGGARPKVLMKVNGEHWIVKFRSAFDTKDIGVIEYQYSLDAKKCGIEMPETRLFEGKYFGGRRFDRDGDIRYHMHTAGGLLYASHRLPSLDYTDSFCIITVTFVDITGCNHLNFLFPKKILHITGTLRSGPDKSHHNPVAGSSGPVLTQGSARNDIGQCDCSPGCTGHFSEERPPVYNFWLTHIILGLIPVKLIKIIIRLTAFQKLSTL